MKIVSDPDVALPQVFKVSVPDYVETHPVRSDHRGGKDCRLHDRSPKIEVSRQLRFSIANVVDDLRGEPFSRFKSNSRCHKMIGMIIRINARVQLMDV